MISELGLVFHHIGIATRSIEREKMIYEQLGFGVEAKAFIDPIQKIQGLFMVHASGFRIELLEPAAEQSPLDGFLKKGFGMYHQGYLSPFFDQGLEKMLSLGAAQITQPAPAVGFGGARICFFLMPNRMMIELIEVKESQS